VARQAACRENRTGQERKLSRVCGELARKAAIFIGRQSGKAGQKTNGLCCRTIGGRVNNWGIPDWLEKEVIERDKTCVYCGIQMIEKMPPHGLRKTVATWEHIINDASIVSRENIARCCVACNSSKGTKKLSDWIQSSYCKKLGINKDTVAEVVKKALLASS